MLPHSPELQQIYDRIREVPDFPKPGVLFKDITPLLLDARLFRRAVELMAAPFGAARGTRSLPQSGGRPGIAVCWRSIAHWRGGPGRDWPRRKES